MAVCCVIVRVVGNMGSYAERRWLGKIARNNLSIFQVAILIISCSISPRVREATRSLSSVAVSVDVTLIS